MGDPLVVLEDVSLRFRVSWHKVRTLNERLNEIFHRIFFHHRPSYFTALDHVHFSARQGDVIGLIGGNGAGKSTLLRLIAGIYEPDQGIVRRGSKNISLLALKAGFQPNLSGIENIRLSGLLMGLSLRAIEEKIPEIVEFADIGDHIHSPVKYYSSGMAARVGFATALAVRPEIILIDEALSVGDKAFQEKSEEAIEKMLREASCQIIATHNLKFVRDRCTRALYLKRGRVVLDGAPNDVVDLYENEIAAEKAAKLAKVAQARAAAASS